MCNKMNQVSIKLEKLFLEILFLFLFLVASLHLNFFFSVVIKTSSKIQLIYNTV